MEIFGICIAAILIGTAIGWERESKGKSAGITTYALITLGAAVFANIGAQFPGDYHIVGQVVSALGFIAGGMIFRQGDHVTNLSSAAECWLCAGIGVSLGYSLWSIAISATLSCFFIVFCLKWIKNKVLHKIDTSKEEKR